MLSSAPLLAEDGLSPSVLGSNPNCFLVKVFNHRQGYDGTICEHATNWLCGAGQATRDKNCDPPPPEEQRPVCWDMHLFARGREHLNRLILDRQRDNLKLLTVIKPGDLLIFWTYKAHTRDGGRNWTSPTLGVEAIFVGLYVVERAITNHYSQPTYTYFPTPDKFLRFDPAILIPKNLLWVQNFVRTLDPEEAASSLGFLLDEISRDARYLRKEAQDRQLLDDEDTRRRRTELLARYGRQTDLLADLMGQKWSYYARDEQPGYDEFYEEAAKPTPYSASTSASPPNNGGGTNLLEGLRNIELAPSPVQTMAEVASSQGLYYPPDLLTRFHISMQTSQLVILTGPSGTGKSRLGEVYAQAAGAVYHPVEVKPDWVSASSLWGAFDYLSGRFVPEQFARLVKEAGEEYLAAGIARRRPRLTVICLDEMNLARVEYYLADILSAMERPPDRRIVDLYSKELGAEGGFPCELLLPPNLRLVGTINADETTLSLSPKVLDRAHLIRLDHVDLDKLRALLEAEIEGGVLDFVFKHLQEINTAMQDDPAQQFGYRVARQIAEWVSVATDAPYAMPIAEALDVEITQKILSRLQVDPDNSAQVSVLNNLFAYFRGQGAQFARTANWLQARKQRMDNLAEAISGQQ